MCQIIKGVVNTMKYEEEKHPLFNQEALDQYVEDTSQYYTENMKNAMHLWPNGKMTSSTYEGVRGDDHQVISNYFDNIDMPELTKLKRSEVMKVAAEGVGVLIGVPSAYGKFVSIRITNSRNINV